MLWCPGLGFSSVDVHGKGQQESHPCTLVPALESLCTARNCIIPSVFSRVLRKAMLLPGVRPALMWKEACADVGRIPVAAPLFLPLLITGSSNYGTEQGAAFI